MAKNISVVIPLYNSEKVIARAIRSVLNQSYPHFELITVNDGSTDKSQIVIEEFTDDRIRMLEQENQGVSIARNRGVEVARYELIAFLDADDEWLPDYLERMVKFIDKYPDCGIYGSASLRYDGKHTYRFLLPILDFPYGWEGIFENYFNYVDYIIPYHTSAVIVAKEAFTEIGGFQKKLRCWQDTDVWMRLAIQYQAAFVNIPLSIFHLETENSGSKIYANIEELQYLISEWKTLLAEGRIPSLYEESYKEFIARYQIMCAKKFLSKGLYRPARDILDEILPSSSYSKDAKLLKRRTYIPRVIFRILLASYSQVKWICTKFEQQYGLNI